MSNKAIYYISCKSISQGEQNGANFSFIAPSSNESKRSTKKPSISSKTSYYSPWFSAKHLQWIPSERASQEEQNGANFSFIAPSREES